MQKPPLIEVGLRNLQPQNQFFFPWTNYDNIQFYEDVPLEIIKKFALDSGLSNCCDVKLILSYILQSNSLLEVGAGYGRVLQFILGHKYQQKLYALERCQKFVQLLKLKFSSNVEIIDVDLHNFQTINKFDLILWLWGGIANFSKIEQNSMLNRLKNSLTNNGLIIIETLADSTKPINIIQEMGQDYIIEANGKTMHAYCPSYDEFNEYAKANKLSIIKRIDYKTEKNMQRVMYILKNNQN